MVKSKKITAIAVMAAVLLAAVGLAFTGIFKTSHAAAEEVTVKSTAIEYGKLGEFLTGISKSSSTGTGNARYVYDNSGMNGRDGITHKHTNLNPATKMWLSKAGDSAADSALTVELDEPNQIGYMFVWNYNANGRTDNGMRKVTVDTSLDGEKWQSAGSFELARAAGTGETKATNLTDGEPIDLGGACAKYVRITPAEQNGNWGGSQYGLSEVKLYEYKEKAAKNAFIKGDTYNPASTTRDSATRVITSGAGMSDPKSSRAVHDNAPEHMWLGSSSTIRINLKGNYPLSDLYIWNYNSPDALDCGVKEVEVSVSSDGGAQASDWIKAGTFTVNKATGSNTEKASARIPLGNIKGQCISVRIISNYGGDKNGIAAIRAYCGEGDYSEQAHEWSSVLGTYTGFFGADGIFTANLSGNEYAYSLDKRGADNKTFFCFSDTDVDYAKNGINEVARTSSNYGMPNNSYAMFTGNDPFTGEMVFMYDQTTSGSANVPIRPTRQGNGARYWLGAMASVNGKMYITPHFIESVTGGMGFAQTAADFAKFDINKTAGTVNFNSYNVWQDDSKQYLAWFENGGENRVVLMNSGLFANTEESGAPNPDGYVYNYGILDASGKARKLVVARIKAEDIEDITKYEYYSGSGWSKNISDLKGIADYVSPELSVVPVTFGEYKGKYMLTYQYSTQSALTAIRISDTPYGPFGEQKLINYSMEPLYMTALYQKNSGKNDANAYCYNAKAHPALSKDGELIISYNMNFLGGTDSHERNIDCYHPRFLRYSATAYSVSDNDGIEGTESNSGNKKRGCGGNVASVGGFGALGVLATATAAGMIMLSVRRKKEMTK